MRSKIKLWAFLKEPRQMYPRLRKRYSKTELALLLVALIAILILLTTLFLPYGSVSGKQKITDPVVIGTPEFITTLSRLTNTPVEEGDEVKILNNGDEFLPAVVSAIDTASSTINFTTYIWKKGKFSDAIFAALIRAAKRGVEVRVLLDGIAGKAPKEDVKALEAAGGKIESFHSLTYSKILRFNQRTHRRAMIMDGKIGFTGGIAVADQWLGNGHEENQWRDMMFEVTGSMAESLQSAFVDGWDQTTAEVLTGPTFYPLPPVASTSQNPKNIFVNLVSAPSPDEQPVPIFFLLTVLSAQKKIYITNPYMLPDAAFLKALQDKARAGVDVEILVPGPHTDGKQVRWASHINYSDLLEAGVKIYEYQPVMLHTKVIVADSQWSLIGSANIDSRSRMLNNENMMGIQDPKLAGELEETFKNDLTYAKEITLSDWKKRGPFSYLFTYLSFFFVKQY